MQIEPITESNIESIWGLYQRTVSECDRIPLELFKFKILGDPDPDPELTLVMLDSSVPVSFMAAVCRQTPDGPVGCLKVWATDSERQGRGLAKSLLERIEQRF